MGEDKEILISNKKEIGFGQIVLIKKGSNDNPPEPFVVLDPEKTHGFIEVAKIVNEEDRISLGGIGGAKPDDIKEVTNEKWSLEEISEGIRKRFNYEKLPEEIVKRLQKASQKPPEKV